MIITGFYSDPHFGHSKIIEYCSRPFVDVAEMNAELIKRYNAVIGTEHTVMWTGDCFFMNVEKAKVIMSQLNGRKILVRGNHDRSMGSMAGMGFDLVMEECLMMIAGRPVRIKHYPYAGNKAHDGHVDDRYMDLRPERVKGEILIHGHSHSKNKVFENQVHVGVDAWNYAPAMWSDVEALVAKI